MAGLIAFWSHAFSASLFAALVIWELRRGIRIGGGQRMLLAALALTACWAWLTAVEPFSMLAAYAETARNLVWVGVLYRLAGMGSDEVRQRGVHRLHHVVGAFGGRDVDVGEAGLGGAGNRFGAVGVAADKSSGRERAAGSARPGQRVRGDLVSSPRPRSYESHEKRAMAAEELRRMTPLNANCGAE